METQDSTSGHLQHALDRNENVTGERSSHCPCRFDVDPFYPPPFVGDDYFCDAGNEEFMTGERLTLCGIELTVFAVILLHGSTSSCHSPPLTISQ